MPKDLMKYECLRCGWIYNPAEGDPDGGIKPGTPFKDIPNSWKCPVCGASKSDFAPYPEDFFLCRFRNKTSDEQHNSALGLHKGFRKTHYHGIDLRRCNRLPVFPDMQPPAVDDLRNLFSPQPAVAFSQNIQNRLFNLHFRFTKCSNLSYKMFKTTLLLNSQEKHREGFHQCQ